jgi:hypothetical protein
MGRLRVSAGMLLEIRAENKNVARRGLIFMVFLLE